MLNLTGTPNICQRMHKFLRLSLLFRTIYSLAIIFMIPNEKEICNSANNREHHSKIEDSTTSSDDGDELSLKTILSTLLKTSSTLRAKCLCISQEEFQFFISATIAESHSHGTDTPGKGNTESDDISNIRSHTSSSAL